MDLLVTILSVLYISSPHSGVLGQSGWYDDGEYYYNHWDEPDFDYGYDYSDTGKPSIAV